MIYIEALLFILFGIFAYYASGKKRELILVLPFYVIFVIFILYALNP